VGQNTYCGENALCLILPWAIFQRKMAAVCEAIVLDVETEVGSGSS